MRELKFRVWDNENKSYDDPYPYAYYALTQDGGLDFYCHGDHMDEADPGVYFIEQYTGLKDKNGREIYEGDIVEVCDKHVSFVHMHPCGEWVLPQFLDKEDKPITSLLWHCDKKQVEVIGNIHENPELLKEKE